MLWHYLILKIDFCTSKTNQTHLIDKRKNSSIKKCKKKKKKN
jgi:hypothetical protein